MPSEFTGESRYRIDEKDRVPVPPEYRELLGPIAMLARGDDGQIDIFPRPHFDILLERLANSNSALYRRKARFMRAANSCVVDKSYRISIPEVLKEHANIGHDVVIVGNGDHFEMWNPDSWRAFYQDFVQHNAAVMDDLAAYTAGVSPSPGAAVQ
jgi:MraZ protein